MQLVGAQDANTYHFDPRFAEIGDTLTLPDLQSKSWLDCSTISPVLRGNKLPLACSKAVLADYSGW